MDVARTAELSSADASVIGVRPSSVYRMLKRLLDIAFVVVTAPVSLLIVGTLAILISLDGHNPFYTQKRVGRGNRVFRLFKLRTMVPDAERVLREYLAENREAAREWHENQKLRDDPRITPFGAFVRKHSLDELPQLLNVLIGDMSLVGPRPMTPDQRVLYPGDAYYQMRPGLTGLWQVTARNDSSFASRAVYDTRYGQTMSLGADLWILAMTVGVVLRGTGV